MGFCCLVVLHLSGRLGRAQRWVGACLQKVPLRSHRNTSPPPKQPTTAGDDADSSRVSEDLRRRGSCTDCLLSMTDEEATGVHTPARRTPRVARPWRYEDGVVGVDGEVLYCDAVELRMMLSWLAPGCKWILTRWYACQACLPRLSLGEPCRSLHCRPRHCPLLFFFPGNLVIPRIRHAAASGRERGDMTCSSRTEGRGRRRRHHTWCICRCALSMSGSACGLMVSWTVGRGRGAASRGAAGSFVQTAG